MIIYYSFHINDSKMILTDQFCFLQEGFWFIECNLEKLTKVMIKQDTLKDNLYTFTLNSPPVPNPKELLALIWRNKSYVILQNWLLS